MVSRGSQATWAHLLWAISNSLHIPTTVAHKTRIHRLIATYILDAVDVRTSVKLSSIDNSHFTNILFGIFFRQFFLHVYRNNIVKFSVILCKYFIKGFKMNYLWLSNKGGGDLFLWIINGTLLFLRKINLSLLFLRKIIWR